MTEGEDRRFCCLLPFFLSRRAGRRGSVGSLKPSAGLAVVSWARTCISRAVCLRDCGGRRFAPDAFLFMFSPNCFIMPNLSSLEDASYHVQILCKLLYWHRNNRCLIYVVIFKKRDICTFWECYDCSCFSVGFFWLMILYCNVKTEEEFRHSLETPHDEIPNSSPLTGYHSTQCRQQSIKTLLSK